MNFLTIRPASAQEAALIRRLALEIWPVAYRHILSADQLHYMLNLFYTEESLAKQMAEGQQFFLLLAAEEAIGFAAVGCIENHLWKLHKLYVLPQWQGSGMGQQLLSYVSEYALSGGATALVLQVNRENSAKGFYERNGFRVTAEKDFDIGNGYFMNDFLMEKTL